MMRYTSVWLVDEEGLWWRREVFNQTVSAGTFDPDARSQYFWTSYVEGTCWHDRSFSLNPNISLSTEVILGYQSLIFVWNLWRLGEAPQQSAPIHSVRMLLCRCGVGSLRAEGRKVFMDWVTSRDVKAEPALWVNVEKNCGEPKRDESFERID